MTVYFKSQHRLILLLFICRVVIVSKKIFYQKIHDGSYLVAFPLKFIKNSSEFKQELGKIFHLKENSNRNSSGGNEKHQFINFDLYPRTENPVDIQKSQDSAILTKLKNLCYNTKQYETRQQKLEAFKFGPCSPVVVVPGILATSLTLQIDCAKLRQYNNGEIFRNCGWSTCSPMAINTPDDVYLLWVGLQLSLKVTEGYTKCFGDLFGLLYNSTSQSLNFTERYSSIAGLKSTWFGNDEKSAPYSDCGANAIRDISGYVSMLSVMGSQCALNDFGRLIDMLKVMGYQPGITLQPLPYDFRYGILASSTPQLLPQVINNLYYATGKKVVVIAHSLGTLHTLINLAYFISEEDKNKMIRHYIPITPPWFGTVSAIRNMLYGDPSYFTKGLLDSGINKYAQMKFSTNSGSTYDLFLRDAFHRFQNQSWMKQVIQRIEYQKQDINASNTKKTTSDYPLNWFPQKTQKCFQPYFKKNYHCETGFINFLETPIFEINGSKYFGTEEDITRLINENLNDSQAKAAISLWAETKVRNRTLEDMPAPGVNTSIIFTTLYDTQIFYNYSKRPKDDNSDANTFILPTDIGNSPGDISVPSFSPLLFAAKWIHNQQNGNHSINLIQYCANYSKYRKHYSTLPCECGLNPLKNQLDCTHPCIISDKHIIAFVLGILTNSMNAYSDEHLNDAVKLNQQQLFNRINQCSNLQVGNWMGPRSQQFDQ